MIEQKQSRNQTVDVLRGLAMIMVVLGHTLTGSSVGAENSFLFNVIWTLQMPLFMLISGYVTKYSRPVNSGTDLGKYVYRKTLAYLFPWAIWTFLVRGVVFGQSSFLDVRHILFNMDSGYWFLFSLWSIVLVFGVAQFLVERLLKEKGKYTKLAAFTIAYVLGMAILAGFGFIAGFSFLGIKLTLYYMPFYFAGFLYGRLGEDVEKVKYGKGIKELVVAVSLLVWIVLLERFNFFEIGEGLFSILLRATASLTGCIAVCGLLAKALEAGKTNPIFSGGGGVGRYSLEIYLIHGFVTALVRTTPLPTFVSAQGIGLVCCNFIITVVLSYGLAILLNKNKWLRLVLFGKQR